MTCRIGLIIIRKLHRLDARDGFVDEQLIDPEISPADVIVISHPELNVPNTVCSFRQVCAGRET